MATAIFWPTKTYQPKPTNTEDIDNPHLVNHYPIPSRTIVVFFTGFFFDFPRFGDGGGGGGGGSGIGGGRGISRDDTLLTYSSIFSFMEKALRT